MAEATDLELEPFAPEARGAPREPAARPDAANNLAPVLDVPVSVTAVLGRARISVAELLALGAGSVVELDRKVGEAVDVYVGGRLVARGEIVIADGRLGVTLSQIVRDEV